MLHAETVEPGTFSLLKELSALPILNRFSLVGGTALALRFGHRSSIDLDFFSNEKFDQPQLVEALESVFGNRFVYKQQHAHFGVFCFIDGAKVDFVYFPHNLIRPVANLYGINFYSNEDIAAMKIQAILGRAKKKDFWDLFELLKHFSLAQIIDFHRQKYPSQMLLISIPHAITYFVDAEESETPVSLKNQTWEEVKRGIQKAVRDYLT